MTERDREALRALEDLDALHDGEGASGPAIRHALTLARRGGEASWRPIETAPKDLRWVLIAGGTISTGDLHDHEYTGVGIAVWNPTRAAWVRDGADWIHHPTHWMPLPAPPEGEEGGGQ